jgi:hypothetical protein
MQTPIVTELNRASAHAGWCCVVAAAREGEQPSSTATPSLSTPITTTPPMPRAPRRSLMSFSLGPGP